MDVRQPLLTRGFAGIRPALFRQGGGDAEVAHHRMVDSLAYLSSNRAALKALSVATRGRRTPRTVAGLRFPGTVGLAAGMDKDARAVPAWAALGFSHVEVGTLTPRPQPGNEMPRLFRLPSSKAVVNRMGFNNGGALSAGARLAEVDPGDMVVGVSIGKNKTTPLEGALDDYVDALEAVEHAADYVAINVSSPNTPGLRSLQGADHLRELVHRVATRAAQTRIPVFVKLAPDMTDEALAEAVGVAASAGAAGIIATNTTLSRDGVSLRDVVVAQQAGGLSGAPLTKRAREVVSFLAAQTDLPIIGVGGVMTVDDGLAMVDAGASLVQVYTGLIYAGPGLVRGIEAALAARASD